jgi:hypothetical protein
LQSIDLIRENLTRSESIALARVDEMRDHCFVFPTPRGGAHTLWTLGHLAFIEGQVVRQFMLGEPNPLSDWEEPFDGSDVSGAKGDYPPFEQVLAACRKSRADTLALLDTLTEEDLDRPSANAPDGFAELFGTYRRCLQFVADHWFMHRGQLADARRAAGLERSWF